MHSAPNPETFYIRSGSSPPAVDREARVTPPVTASDQALNALQTGGRSRHDRRSYVLLERPKLPPPTPAQRELLTKFLADLLVEAVTRKRREVRTPMP
jgi:hypothetical protein